MARREKREVVSTSLLLFSSALEKRFDMSMNIRTFLDDLRTNIMFTPTIFHSQMNIESSHSQP